MRPLSANEHQLMAEAKAAQRSGRWTPSRKAAVLSLIHQGAITQADACEQFDLSAEELGSWQRRAKSHGTAGLSVTRLQMIGRRA